ncbi:MAG: branched-chain amino acid ABC transporter permease [Deltaproteobacteria bacterium]|jgi:branched-chain amino acid transport system permease protein|nr:branched-chain amino acid ABC transporter permease [Deltaproteobacteria bacterium]
MMEFLEQLTNGLARGGIYALIALGYTMVYGVMKLINFAHGELFALGAYLGYCLLVTTNLAGSLGPYLAIGLTIIMVMGLVSLAGHVLERVAYRPLRHADRLAAVVSALGASIFLQNAIMLVWGARFRAFGSNLFPNFLITIGGLKIPLIRIVVLASALLVMWALRIFIHRSRMGLAIRAAAIDQKAAKLMGVDVRQVITVVFIIGPALGGLAGLLVGLYYGQINFNIGQLYGLKAFTAAIIGGIGNITGAMVGGLLLGLIETLGAGYISVGWKDAFTFVVLILILIVRPTGLLPERVVEKL